MASMEEDAILHKGYLVEGDEINIKGGYTLQFHKKQRKYFILQHLGGNSLLLQGYKDEKAVLKRGSSSSFGRQRKASNTVIFIHFRPPLKVHTVQLETKKRVENVLIVVSGTETKFFRPDTREDLAKWFEVFKNFSAGHEMKGRRSKKGAHVPERGEEEPDNSRRSIPLPASQLANPGLERDSGISTLSRRSSQGSYRSSSSSDDSGEYSLNPRDILPSMVYFDSGEENEQTHSPKTSMSKFGAKGIRSRDWRRSVFMRNEHGSFEEIPEESVESSRESCESGLCDTDSIADCSSYRYSESPVDSTSDDVDQAKYIYDFLPTRRSNNSPDEDIDNQPALPLKQKKIRGQGSMDSTDSSIPDSPRSSVSETLANRHGTEHISEMEAVLNDDGSKHTYINLRPPGKRLSFADNGDSFDEIKSTPVVDYRRKTSLPGLSDPPIFRESPTRCRADTLPIMFTESEEDNSLQNRPLPKPDLDRAFDIETLHWEQSQGINIMVHVEMDVANALALVDIHGKVWIAGWKKTETHKVYGQIHVGDQLVQVNDQVVNNSELANTFIRTSCKPKIILHIRRLPNAKIVNCKRESKMTPWGIEFKGNELTQVQSGPATDAGLSPRAMGVHSKKLCEWIVTEITHHPIRFNCAKDELKLYMKNNYLLRLPLVLHPKDFVCDLNRALSKLKQASQFQVG